MRRGRDRVERGGRLVHQQDLGLDRERSARCRAAAAGRPRAARRCGSRRSLTSSHSAAWRSALLDALVDVAASSPIERGPKATLSKIDFGNGLGFWKTMPMRRRTSTASTVRRVDVHAVEGHRALDPRARHEIVHAVERAQERRLAAARRPDERRHLALAHVEGHVADRRHAVVAHHEVAHLEDGCARRRAVVDLGAHLDRAKRDVAHPGSIAIARARRRALAA